MSFLGNHTLGPPSNNSNPNPNQRSLFQQQQQSSSTLFGPAPNSNFNSNPFRSTSLPQPPPPPPIPTFTKPGGPGFQSPPPRTLESQMGSIFIPTCKLPGGIWQANPQNPNANPMPGWYGFGPGSRLDFDVCEGCYAQLSSSSSTAHLAKLFSPQPPKPPGQPAVRCDMSTKWIRIALLLTQVRNLTSLSLLETAAQTSESFSASGDVCPENANPSRQWYSIASPSGTPSPNWCVCNYCRAMLGVLCPTLKNLFKPMYYTAPGNPASVWGAQECVGGCDLGITSPQEAADRCEKYLLLLLDADNDSFDKINPGPSISQFHSYVEKFSLVPVCKKDNEDQEGVFYSINQIGDFTVCQECFLNVIEPVEQGGNPWGFTQRPPGSMVWSCQLYSDRMRRIYSEAVANSDLPFLRAKANERKTQERQVRVTLKTLAAQKAQAQQSMLAHTKMRGSVAVLAISGGGGWGSSYGLAESARMGNMAVEDAGRSDRITAEIQAVLNEWRTMYE